MLQLMKSEKIINTFCFQQSLVKYTLYIFYVYILRQSLRTLVPENFLTYGPGIFFTDRYCYDEIFCLFSALKNLDHFGVTFNKLFEPIDPLIQKASSFLLIS